MDNEIIKLLITSLTGLLSTVLGALITAWATIKAENIKRANQEPKPNTPLITIPITPSPQGENKNSGSSRLNMRLLFRQKLFNRKTISIALLIGLIFSGLAGYNLFSSPKLPPQITQIPSTKTLIPTSPTSSPTKTPISSVEGLISLDLPPSSTFHARSYPSISLGDDVGAVVAPGDKVTITAWTRDLWNWYRVDVPSKNLKDVWVSGSWRNGDKSYKVVVTNTGEEAPLQLYVVFSKISTPSP